MSAYTVPLPAYSVREEKLNILSHAAGAVVFGGASVWLLIKAFTVLGGIRPFFFLLYSVCLVELYVMSSVYHGTKNPERRRLTQKGDHTSVNILIMGSDIAFLSGVLFDKTAFILSGCVVALSLMSIVFNLINVKKFRAVTMVTYIITGWCCLIVVKQLMQTLGQTAFAFLLAGGLVYTSGLVFYGLKREFSHAVWHLFVLLGSILQFAAIMIFLYRG